MMRGLIRFMLMGLFLVTMLFSIGWASVGRVSARQLSESDFESTTTATPLMQTEVMALGLSFDKGTTRVPLGKNTKIVSVTNPNGKTEIKQGPVKDIEIHIMVVMNHASTKEEAKAIANKVKLQVKEGTVLDIQTSFQSYGKGDLYEPSIDMSITLPQEMKSDLHADTENGNLFLSKVTSIGEILLTSVNGNITAKGIGNDISLHTENGIVRVSDAEKSVRASATNGNIEADYISGPLDMKATNGNLSSKGAFSSIKAVTVTGNIHIESGEVGGHWNMSSDVGNVYLAWPESAEVEVDAKTTIGEPQTDFPLTIKSNRVTGKVGDGTYHIDASSMGGLSLIKTS